MKVKVLGSVSPYSKGENNCPGYLVTDGDTKILLDCGNGITRLMNMKNDLNNLKIIISHLHKDHYGDLLSIGLASYVYKNLGYIKKRIPVYIPLDDSNDFNFLNNFGEEHFLEFFCYNENSKLNIDNTIVTFSLNPHQVKSYSTRIDNKDISLVYSGDTGYANNTLERLAQNTDLLICESTFLKNQNKVLDYHLCAFEAALIAKKAGAYKLLLTHFWPEINKKKYVKEASTIFTNVQAVEERKVYIIKK